MKLLSSIFGRSSNADDGPQTTNTFDVEIKDHGQAILDAVAETQAKEDVPHARVPFGDDSEAEVDDVSPVNLETMSHVLDTVGKPREDQVSIWDLEDDDDPDPAETPVIPRAEPGTRGSRNRRNRTRLIGFDTTQGDVVDLFESSEKLQETDQTRFPVGWLLVIDGPGRGHCFALTSGMAQIGRGEENAIQLDFGDAAISRQNHAAIVYDPQTRAFLLGHGGKANIVRLNGAPVISNENLSDGDMISVGETTLLVKTVCGPDFDWGDTADTQEDGHVAIA